MAASLRIGRFLDEDEITGENEEIGTDPISFEELFESIKVLPKVRFKPDKKIPPLVKFRFEELQVFITREEAAEFVDKEDWYTIFSWDEVDGTILFNSRTTNRSDDLIWKTATHIADVNKASIIDGDGEVLYEAVSEES